MPVKKILLVDDSKTELHHLSELLTKRGYAVRTAENGEEALKRLAEEKPDLILMDVVMPGQNGFQLTRAITRDPNFADVPTLAESGLKDVSVSIWFGVLAPANLPAAVRERLEKEVAAITKDPEGIERLKKIGYTWAHLDPASFKDNAVKEIAQWKGVAEAANIKLD